MSFAKKVAVAVNLNDPLRDHLALIRDLDFLTESEIHFVSVHRTATYAIGLGESSIVYPLDIDQKRIHEKTVAELMRLAPEILPQGFKGKLVAHCLFGDDPKRRFCDYVSEVGIDTIIVAAREKKGLFESSFTQFVTKHTRANVIVLKRS